MEFIAKFDKEFRQRKSTYNFFANIHDIIKKGIYSRIVLDLSEYKYINPVYGVLIGSMPYVGNMYGCKIIIRVNPLNDNCNEFLNNLGLFEHYNVARNKNKNIDLNFKNVKFKKYENIEKALPTIGKILETAPVEFSEELEEIMASKLAEIFLNAFTHSRSEIGVFCSGYIKSSTFYFSIYDAGIGIHKNVNDYLNCDIDALDALKWAFMPGNSTLNATLKVDYPRGAGLSLFDSFAKTNNGCFDLVSGKAYRKMHSCNEKYEYLDNEFQGTIISISIKSDKLSRYVLNKEKEDLPC